MEAARTTYGVKRTLRNDRYFTTVRMNEEVLKLLPENWTFFFFQLKIDGGAEKKWEIFHPPELSSVVVLVSGACVASEPAIRPLHIPALY